MILTFLINSLIIFGIFAVTEEKSLLGFVQMWGTKYNLYGQHSKFWSKPLFNCPPCMASVWGTLGFAYTGIGWQYWIVWVVSLAGFNYIVNKLLDK